MPLLIPAAWAVLFFAFASSERPLREAALNAAAGIAVGILLITEVLSAASALSFWPTTALWAGSVALAAFTQRGRILAGLRRVRATLGSPKSTRDVLFAAVLGFFGLGTLLSAALYPSTNYDSLTYHMPRVFFWFQNTSVAHYPTTEGRQLFSSAFVEYAVLQLKILSGGSDKLAGMVQWFAFLMVILAVSLVAKKLGAGVRGQQFASLTAAATPMAVLQASTTQNDLTCSLWSLAAVYWVMEYITRGESQGVQWAPILGLGSALALATQSKPTAYLFLAPFIVWLAIVALRRVGWARTTGLALCVLFIMLGLNAGWYVRNSTTLGGDPLALDAPGNTHILVQDRSADALVANALKNGSMNLGTPSPVVNDAIARTVRTLIVAIGSDPQNPLTVEDPSVRYEIGSRVTNHDVGPSPFVVVMIVASMAFILVVSDRNRAITVPYVICAFSSVLLVAALVKWNPFVNRVLLPSVLLSVPLVGLAADWLSARSRSGRLVVAGFVVLALSWSAVAMLFNTTNRLVPQGLLGIMIGNRDVGYWNTSYEDLRFRVLVPGMEEPLKRVAAAIRSEGVQRIGLDVRAGDFPIFPLLAMLPDREFGYVGETVAGDGSGFSTGDSAAVLEVIPEDSYTPGSESPEELLLPPQKAMGWVLLLRRV